MEEGYEDSSEGSDSLQQQEDRGGAYSADALVAQAYKALNSLNQELAAQFFERALQSDPNHLEALDEFAELLLGAGNVGRAARLLQHSIALAPEAGHSKYMNLGQILEGREAVQCFERGVALMDRRLRSMDPAGDARLRQALARELSAGHVSIAELWMTDLCFEPEAEQSCVRAATLAVEADPTHADAHHTLASLLISQGKNGEALTALHRGYALWKADDDDDDDNDNDAAAGGNNGGGAGVRMRISKGRKGGPAQNDNDDDDNDDDDDDDGPSYASRLNAGKMFVELNEPEIALDIFNDLVLENEDDPELYFLTALATPEQEERRQQLQLAMEKIQKAEREGATDLEHLTRAVQNAIAANK